MKQNFKKPLFIFKIVGLLVLFVAGICLSVPPATLLLLIPLGLVWFLPLPHKIPHAVVAVIASTIFIIITQLMAGYSLLIFQIPLYLIFNIAVYLFPMFLCSFFYHKTKIPFYTFFILGMAIALVQFYTNLFRGFPATISDIPSIKTALSVMTNYSYSVSPNMWIGFVCFLLTIRLFSYAKKPSLFHFLCSCCYFYRRSSVFFQL